jgi:predicted site-specific integrase-resolvase
MSLLSIDDLKTIFKVSRQTIHNWRHSGIIPEPISLGRRRYWKEEQISEIINNKQKHEL